MQLLKLEQKAVTQVIPKVGLLGDTSLPRSTIKELGDFKVRHVDFLLGMALECSNDLEGGSVSYLKIAHSFLQSGYHHELGQAIRMLILDLSLDPFNRAKLISIYHHMIHESKDETFVAYHKPRLKVVLELFKDFKK